MLLIIMILNARFTILKRELNLLMIEIFVSELGTTVLLKITLKACILLLSILNPHFSIMNVSIPCAINSFVIISFPFLHHGFFVFQ